MEKNKIVAIVLAAGTGSRMKSAQKKQFMDLCGYPLIYYALQVFEHSSQVDEVIIVTGREDISYCHKEIVERYGFHKVKSIVAGGEERYLSVYEGLKAVTNAKYVLIHDGARPFIQQKHIDEIVQSLEHGDACILGMPVKDTIKKADVNQYVQETPDRKDLWTIQTPQAFPYQVIKEAYKRAIQEKIEAITDDAMVLEKTFQIPVKILKGGYYNIKVTTPEDLQIAEVFVKSLIGKNIKKI